MGSFGSYFAPLRHLLLPKKCLLRSTATPFRINTVFLSGSAQKNTVVHLRQLFFLVNTKLFSGQILFGSSICPQYFTLITLSSCGLSEFFFFLHAALVQTSFCPHAVNSRSALVQFSFSRSALAQSTLVLLIMAAPDGAPVHSINL